MKNKLGCQGCDVLGEHLNLDGYCPACQFDQLKASALLTRDGLPIQGYSAQGVFGSGPVVSVCMGVDYRGRTEDYLFTTQNHL